MNSKYIKKCDLLKLFPRREFCFSVLVRSRITSAPTEEDVEKVVRCKDCKWRTDCDFYNKKGICVNRRCAAGRYGLEVPDEHFCSYGERKGK